MRLVHGAQDDRYLIEKPAMIAAPPASLAKHEPQGQPHQNDAASNGHPQRETGGFQHSLMPGQLTAQRTIIVTTATTRDSHCAIAIGSAARAWAACLSSNRAFHQMSAGSGSAPSLRESSTSRPIQTAASGSFTASPR